MDRLRINAKHEARDHVIVVGNVLELAVASEGHPLPFPRGRDWRLETET